jgi:hypothetical protein
MSIVSKIANAISGKAEGSATSIQARIEQARATIAELEERYHWSSLKWAEDPSTYDEFKAVDDQLQETRRTLRGLEAALVAASERSAAEERQQHRERRASQIHSFTMAARASEKIAAELSEHLAKATELYKKLQAKRDLMRRAVPIGSTVPLSGSATNFPEVERLVSHEVYRLSASWRNPTLMGEPDLLPTGKPTGFHTLQQPEAIPALVDVMTQADDAWIARFKAESEGVNEIAPPVVMGPLNPLPAGTPTMRAKDAPPLVSEQPTGPKLTEADIQRMLNVPKQKMSAT